MAKEPAYDRASALARLGGDVNVLRELAELFISECPSWLDQLRQAVDGADRESVRRAAHKLRSGVSNFSADAASERLASLEESCAAIPAQALEYQLQLVETDVGRLCADLALFVREGGA